MIQQFKKFCETKIKDFETKVLPLPYEKHGILLWEGFAFCAMAEMLGIQVIIESGIAGGRSTEIWSKYFSFPIFAIDDMKLYGPGQFVKTEARLKKYKQLKLFSGDSNLVIPDILKNETSSDSRTAIFIDGPKGTEAIQLGKHCFEHENVILVGIHDQCLHNHPLIPYHQMDSWDATLFYTDETWFFDRFSYLEYSKINESLELQKELYRFPKGPGVGLAVKTRISHKILDEDGQDVATDLPTMGREHCPRDKARPLWGRRWRDRLFRFAKSL